MRSTSMKKLLSLLMAFAMVFSMITVVAPVKADAATVEIAIPNGDFENGDFGGAVAGYSGAAIVEKSVYEGNYALKFDATGEILTVTGYLAEATTAESTITLSFMAKVLGGSTGNSVNFGLFATNEAWGNRVQKYGAGYPIVGGDWKQISQALTVPANTKIIQAQIYLGSGGTTAIVDNISITDGSGNEILQSGGFEKGALNGDFNANDALEIVCTPVHSGNYAAHADKSAGNGNVTITVSIESSAQARTMKFSFWMYVPTGSTNSAHTMVVCFDTTGGSWTNLSTKYGAQYAAPGSWVQKTMEIAVAANTNTLQIQLYAQDNGANFYIDDLSLTEEVAQVNHNVELSLNQVTGDGTWQFAISEATADKYYKVSAVIDGVACNFLMGESGGIMCVYPNFFTALGGAVPTQQIIIQEGTVLKAVDPNNGWQEIDGADTYTITEKIDLSCVNGAWGNTVYTTDIALELSQVTGDGTWQFYISETPADKYYKVPATIDGVDCSFLMGESGGIMCVYPNFFTALGGVVPTKSLVIAEGALLKAVDSSNGWQEIADAEVLAVTEKIDLSCVNGVWGITVPNVNAELSFNQVTGDGTWQFSISATPADKYYKVPATIDGVDCSFLMGESGDVMCVYPSFFTALGGAIPTQQIIIREGTVLKAVDSNNGWKEIPGAETLTVLADLTVENVLGSWKDMSQYANVEFIPLMAADLDVYKAEDQSASQFRSVFAISSQVAIGNSGWGNFSKVAVQVLVDGVATDVHFGMVPADDEGWGSESAFLLYVVGEGCWDAASNADSIVICAGTKIMPAADATTGFVFAEDFVMYKNCDGSWDTTADTHIYNVENIAAEGALAAQANCLSAAKYYYSCTCGQLGSETFTYGELGDHNYVDGTCDTCGDTISIQNIAVSMQTVTGDGTWQLISSAELANNYYKAAVVIDGVTCNVLVQYASGMMLIYPNFFTALGGAVPAESFVIPAGTMIKAADPANGWAEIEDAAVLAVTEELKIENIYGTWYETSKYADLTFTEIYAADLDLYYQNIMRLGDYSDSEVNMALMMYPQYKELYNYYGRNANMTTFGIKSTIPTLQIPNDVHWSNFTVMGKVTVNGAEPWETYVMQTPASGTDDSETAMDNAFLIRFYNGLVADQAVSITIEPGTMIVTKDGTAGFVFVDGYTLYRGTDGNWSENAPAGINPVQSWGLILGDDISAKFLVNTDETVTFAVNGNAVSAVQDGNYYTISLAAAQMNDPITVYVGGVALEKTYTIRNYADTILSDKLYGEKTQNLVKAMLVYGGAAQTYFGYNTENLASGDLENTAVVPTENAQIAVSDDLNDVAFYGASLLYKNKTAVRFYFTGSVDGLTFQVDGKDCTVNAKGDMYYIEIADINPQNIGDIITVTVTNGTDTLTVEYSPLVYITRMYNKADSSAETKALVQALYGYYLAAAAYTN